MTAKRRSPKAGQVPASPSEANKVPPAKMPGQIKLDEGGRPLVDEGGRPIIVGSSNDPDAS
jgi:hypothetical protein